MSKVIAPLVALFALFLVHPGSAGAQQTDRPPNLSLGDAVVSGFSGTIAPDPSKPRPPNKSAIDLTFINPDGPSARIVDVSKPGYVWDARLFQAPKTFDVYAKDVGQVFGVALDDSTQPNIYVAATSVFGLNIVGRGRDGLPERRKKGGPGAVGNLAYDSDHKQLFVSDLYTGMIHRFALDGRDLGPPYDHGVTGRSAQGNLPAQAFNPSRRLNIATARFDSEDPDTWGYAPPARRGLGARRP